MTEFSIHLKMNYERFPSSPMDRGRRGGFLLGEDLCEEKQEDGVVTYFVVTTLWKLEISPGHLQFRFIILWDRKY
jgi:hypothetical protein